MFLGYPQGIKGYKVLDLTYNSVHISRNIIFYEHIFPYALSSQPSTSYLDDFIFPHCTSESSQSIDTVNLPSSISIDPTSTINVDPSTLPAAPSNAAPAAPSTLPTAAPSATPDSTKLDPIAIPSLNSNLSTFLTVSPLTLPSASNPTLRRSTRSHKPLSYLSQYACKSVNTNPHSGQPYDVSNYLDYSHLGPTFKSFVMAVNSTPSNPASFHQAVQ